MRTIEKHFINALKTGTLKQISELILKNQDKYILCIRKNYVNIYYKGHNLFNIKDDNGEYTVQFDFNHAKKMDKTEYKCLCRKLSELVKYEDVEEKFKNESDVVLYGIRSFIVNEKNCDNLEKIAEIYTKMMDNFFKEHNKLEKIRQQEYFSKYFKYASNCLLFYDRESAVEGKDIEKAFGVKKSLGQPDFMAVRVENDIVKKIIFVEIKSTASACGSISFDKKTKERRIAKSGVLKHNIDFDTILSNYKLRTLMIEQMKETIKIYNELDYLQAKNIKFAKEITFDKLFVFTDGAKIWAETKSNRLCEDRDCYKELKRNNKTAFEGESL